MPIGLPKPMGVGRGSWVSMTALCMPGWARNVHCHWVLTTCYERIIITHKIPPTSSWWIQYQVQGRITSTFMFFSANHTVIPSAEYHGHLFCSLWNFCLLACYHRYLPSHVLITKTENLLFTGYLYFFFMNCLFRLFPHFSTGVLCTFLSDL